MSEYKITDRQLKNIIVRAFDSGEIWGVTYSGWFSPKEKDTNERINEILKNAKRRIKKL